ncbi:hypothetical protein GP486_000870 [Trichoglossum hirsutum]|uniref:Heterokaryon incompatibility domain-containing protein n=1 Tax=Trichoglossum hirsutum TaxID=265104 RepID=A0A9P8RTM6_9PEZI|nr:hypothetical protein GP486_000870 [Trichoglossum hirsutum]
MSRYWYQSLPPIQEVGRTPPFTRLMTLAAGNTPDPLCCSLAVINVENPPPYEALSYVWGRNTAGSPMWCNGIAITITSNLDGALRNLRLPTQARRLWVDAVCIDQENIEERNRQVQYMRLIYKHASRVIVWLGHRTVGVEQAFDLARRIAQLRDQELRGRGPSSGLADQAILNAVIETASAAGQAAAEYLSELFDREYFVRSWCAQEVVASAWCIGRCDGLEMDFFDLISAAPFVIARRGLILPGKPLEFWNSIYLARHPTTAPSLVREVEGSQGKLLTLLASMRDFKATDPRDKVFSVLGISDEGLEPILAITQIMSTRESRTLKFFRRSAIGLANRLNAIGPGVDVGRNPALKPDYNKDLVEVYRDLTRFLIRRSPRTLDVLSHVQHADDPSQSFFPSWVPKWFQPRSASVLTVGMYLAGFCDGHFRYFAITHDSPLRGPSLQPNSLQLDGFRVDQIIKVGEVMVFGLHETIPVESIWNQIFDVPMIPRSGLPYRNGEPLDEAFCMTLMAGVLGGVLGVVPDIMLLGSSPHTIPDYERQSKANIRAFLLESSGFALVSAPENFTGSQAEPSGGISDNFIRPAKMFSYNRRVYLTRKGFIGIGPKVMRPGDEVCVLFGGRMPFIVRPMDGHHVFIGDTYLHDNDIMWGNATKAAMSHRAGINVETFEFR